MGADGLNESLNKIRELKEIYPEFAEIVRLEKLIASASSIFTNEGKKYLKTIPFGAPFINAIEIHLRGDLNYYSDSIFREINQKVKNSLEKDLLNFLDERDAAGIINLLDIYYEDRGDNIREGIKSIVGESYGKEIWKVNNSLDYALNKYKEELREYFQNLKKIYVEQI